MKNERAFLLEWLPVPSLLMGHAGSAASSRQDQQKQDVQVE